MVAHLSQPKPTGRLALEIKFDQYGGFFAYYPRIMARIDDGNLRSRPFLSAAISVLNMHLAASQEPNVCMHAEFGTNDGFPMNHCFLDLAANTVLPVRVTIAGQNANIVYAGTAPQLVAGILQVNATVPVGIASGNAPITLIVGTANSPAGCTISRCSLPNRRWRQMRPQGRSSTPPNGKESQLPLPPTDQETLFLDRPEIPNYELIGQLGSGGMGIVWMARDLRLGRKVALKMPRVELTRDERRLERFMREARAASALNHPNIITIYEVGQVGESWFVAMELIEGLTLRQVMHRGRVPPAEAVRYTRQIAAALEAAHQVCSEASVVITESGT